MKRRLYSLTMLAAVLLAACTDHDNPVSPDGQSNQPQTATDPGPAYTEKSVTVCRDGKSDGQVTLRFYSDMPSVAYIEAADFHRLISNGAVMTVKNQGGQYLLTTTGGTATVDVKTDRLTSTTYDDLISLASLTDPGLPANAPFDGQKYLKFASSTLTSTFKPTVPVTLTFANYGIDLHDDGATVYFPFATLADMYTDVFLHSAAYTGKQVVVSNNVLDISPLALIDKEFAEAPYKRKAVAADMAKYRYGELCFVFDNLFGLPGRNILEKAGLEQLGMDATLDKVDGGQEVKQLLQSTDNMDFCWGLNGLHVLLYDGGHTTMSPISMAPDATADEKREQIMAAADKYPKVSQMYTQWKADYIDTHRAIVKKLAEQRKEAYGDGLYHVNSSKTTAVIIVNSFMDFDSDGWKAYYASDKTDADFQALLDRHAKDNYTTLLYGLQRAKADGVKNLILDLSLNTGGSTDIVCAYIATLGNTNRTTFYSQNVLQGLNITSELLTDRNFDGKFDDSDITAPRFDCSGLRIGVLTSRIAFSCGNLFPALMKDLGYPILGEKTGGGSCSIQCLTTPDGFQYIISGYRDRLTNRNWEDIDPGITPDIPFDYDHFYDIDYLGDQVSGFSRTRAW